jgi:SIR2-like domain
LDDLTAEVLKTEIGERWKNHGNIEDILTYLSHSMPWEEASFSLRKKADFLDLSRIIGRIIIGKQSSSFTLTEAHSKLLTAILKDKSPIVTLNYDTIVESLLMDSEPKQDINDIYPVSLTNANSRSGAGMWGSYPGIACQLYKLHGSVNWFYSGNESYFGEQIYFYPPSSTKVENAKYISDKVNLIIPPTYDKSVFMNNETIRDLWRLAKERIALSETIIFVGYSFPRSDLMIRYFLRDSCSTIKKVIIIDKNQRVVDQAKEIFPEKNICPIISESPIGTYISELEKKKA